MSALLVPTLTQFCIARSAISPYSPDFSPIENLWSKLKIILRSIKTTNYQELGKAIEFAFGSALHRQIFLTGLHTAVIVPHLF